MTNIRFGQERGIDCIPKWNDEKNRDCAQQEITKKLYLPTIHHLYLLLNKAFLQHGQHYNDGENDKSRSAPGTRTVEAERLTVEISHDRTRCPSRTSK
ncbi:hypothetical protein D3C74_423140 [compost metagenome]